MLIDEIAADTDPARGRGDRHRGAGGADRAAARVVLVTTHLEELKALAHMDPRFLNARVGFDSEGMAPTYRLQLGAAGASSAIEIAAADGAAGEHLRSAPGSWR